MTDEEMVGWHHRRSTGRLWRTGKPGMMRFMGSQKLDMTEQLNKKSSLWLSILTVHFFLFAAPGRVPPVHYILSYIDLGFRVRFSKCVTLTWELQIEGGIISLLIPMSTPFCNIQWQDCSIQLWYPSPCTLHLWFHPLSLLV